MKRYASDAVGLARRKDIGASAALSFAASRLWINTTMLALDDAALASHLYRRLCGRETLASALAQGLGRAHRPAARAHRPQPRQEGAAATVGMPWFGHHEDRAPTRGYAATREAAMAASAKSWRRA